MIEEQKNENMNEWITKEIEQLNENRPDYDDLPSLKFEEGKITTFKIIAEKPFDKWIDNDSNIIKKIILVEHNKEKKNLWLNVKNPLYSDLLKGLSENIIHFSVFQSGNGDKTRYSLVKD